jgi:hypothetical protein
MVAEESVLHATDTEEDKLTLTAAGSLTTKEIELEHPVESVTRHT